MPKKRTAHSKRKNQPSTNLTGRSSMPDRLKKEDCLYMDGVIESASHGFYHVKGENGMKFLCTARRMDQLKVQLLVGDAVTVEVPLLGLEPGAKSIRSRICWRLMNTQK